MKKVLLINFLILIIGIFTLEIFFGKWFSKEKYYCSYVLCKTNYKFKHEIFSSEYNGTYSKNSDGLRGNFKNNSNIKILVLGGSTTDQRYLSDNDTWTNQLQKHFEKNNKNFKIANAGIDGQSTIGHIWNFENWFPNIKNLKPEIIIFYIGINDLIPREKSHYDFEKTKFKFSKLYLKQLIKNNSIFYYLFNTIYSNLFDRKKIFQFNKSILKSNLNYSIKSSLSDVNLEIYKKEYLNNNVSLRLNILFDEAQKYNAIPIFITQGTKRWIKKNNDYYGIYSQNKRIKIKLEKKKIYINSADLGILEEKFSNNVIKFCNKKKIFCIDGFNLFNLKTKDTYDLMHLNDKGSKKIAKKIYKEIIKNKESNYK